MANAKVRYTELVTLHRAAGLVVHEPTKEEPTLYVEVTRSGRRYGPDGLVMRWPLDDGQYEIAISYLDMTYEPMTRAGLRGGE